MYITEFLSSCLFVLSSLFFFFPLYFLLSSFIWNRERRTRETKMREISRERESRSEREREMGTEGEIRQRERDAERERLTGERERIRSTMGQSRRSKRCRLVLDRQPVTGGRDFRRLEVVLWWVSGKKGSGEAGSFFRRFLGDFSGGFMWKSLW